MGNTSRDPVDHSRTTRQHAGESMKNGHNAPGLILMGVGVIAFVVSLGSFASGNSAAGVIAAVLAVLLFGGGGLWVMLMHRRVRRRELQWAAAHPEADVQPPAS